MILSPETYTYILIFSISILVVAIIIILCIRFHEHIIRWCKRNQVVPEEIYNIPSNCP